MLDFENQNEAEVTDCYLESLAYFYILLLHLYAVPQYIGLRGWRILKSQLNCLKH